MRRPEFIARQVRRPSGLLGRVLEHVTASETAGENAMALKLLELQADDQVLEIGFGPGRTLRRHGPVLCPGSRECPQETAPAGRGVQSGAAPAVSARSRQAQSRS